MNTYLLLVNAGLYFERTFSFTRLGLAMIEQDKHLALGHTATLTVINDCHV